MPSLHLTTQHESRRCYAPEGGAECGRLSVGTLEVMATPQGPRAVHSATHPDTLPLLACLRGGNISGSRLVARGELPTPPTTHALPKECLPGRKALWIRPSTLLVETLVRWWVPAHSLWLCGDPPRQLSLVGLAFESEANEDAVRSRNFLAYWAPEMEGRGMHIDVLTEIGL